MFWKKDLLLAQEYFAFLLLNMFDLFLTGWIFKHEGLEANGLANWILKHFHLTGFAVYKFIMVVVLILLCEAISLVNVQRARLVVLGGCALYVCVIFWECFLIYKYIDNAPPVTPTQSSSAITAPNLHGANLCPYTA